MPSLYLSFCFQRPPSKHKHEKSIKVVAGLHYTFQKFGLQSWRQDGSRFETILTNPKSFDARIQHFRSLRLLDGGKKGP